MHRTVQYLILFFAVVILQIFLFNNLQLTVYLSIFIYPAFVILLPVEMKGWLILLMALLIGYTMDVFTGMQGLNTAATVFMAFCRPTAVRWLIGKEFVEEGGIPNAAKIGKPKYIRYSTVLILVFCCFFFFLETLTTTGILYTGIKIVTATIASTVTIYAVQLLFNNKKNG